MRFQSERREVQALSDISLSIAEGSFSHCSGQPAAARARFFGS
jgi:hypothetical protein